MCHLAGPECLFWLGVSSQELHFPSFLGDNVAVLQEELMVQSVWRRTPSFVSVTNPRCCFQLARRFAPFREPSQSPLSFRAMDARTDGLGCQREADGAKSWFRCPPGIACRMMYDIFAPHKHLGSYPSLIIIYTHIQAVKNYLENDIMYHVVQNIPDLPN